MFKRFEFKEKEKLIKLLFNTDINEMLSIVDHISFIQWIEYTDLDFSLCIADWKEIEEMKKFVEKHSQETVYSLETNSDTYNLFTGEDLVIELLDSFRIGFDVFDQSELED